MMQDQNCLYSGESSSDSDSSNPERKRNIDQRFQKPVRQHSTSAIFEKQENTLFKEIEK